MDDGQSLQLVKDGRSCDVDEARSAATLAHHDIDIPTDLGLGGTEATGWTCDLSHDCSSINPQ